MEKENRKETGDAVRLAAYAYSKSILEMLLELEVITEEEFARAKTANAELYGTGTGNCIKI